MWIAIDKPMRIFTVSDIHVDFDENARWVKALSACDYLEDVLILAGDLSDSMTRISECFSCLVSKFRYVFYLPGNHECWVSSTSEMNSFEKFDQVLALANACGLITKRARVGEFTIVPLMAWYDFSFGEPDDFIRVAWADFKRCRWPSGYAHPADINEKFLAMNDLSPVEDGSRVMTFSHFLPRIDVMPDYIPPEKRNIYPVLGSDKLDIQIRSLSSEVHIYGHSHVNRLVCIDGVHYLNNAFAYPDETRISRKCLFNVLDGLSTLS